MLPDIILDNENFDDILENARNKIVSIFPEWTDFNYHDPGITMLEMFAWLKESQQYYLNKIGPENIKKYMKLLGIEMRPKIASKTDVTVRSESDLTASKGTKVYAGNICFEADDRTYISSAMIDVCVCEYGTRHTVINRDKFAFGGNLHITPFPSGSGGTFYIGFNKPLKEKEIHHIYFDIDSDDEVKRNPITDPESFIPLVDISIQYFNGAGWKTVDCTDGTYGFLTSGRISLSFDEKHEKCSVGGKEAYFIRFVLYGGEYDSIPIFKSIDFGIMPVTQRNTSAEYVDFPVGSKFSIFSELAVSGETRAFIKGSDGLYTPVSSVSKSFDAETGEMSYDIPLTEDAQAVRIVNLAYGHSVGEPIAYGTGLPFQEYDLGTTELEYESFAIMTELPDSGGKFAEWKKVKDFSASKSDDFVYVFDSARGVITFGDCIRGMAPEGEIFAVGYSTSLGADGNVTKDKINSLGDMNDEIYITNMRMSAGGANEETMDECAVRAYDLIGSTQTLVTDADCESFISKVQGLKIEKCKVLSSGMNNELMISVVVKPYSYDGKGVPGERYIKNILAAVEPVRMLGTQFRVVRPEYAAVAVNVDIHASRDHASPRKTVTRAVERFFDAIKDDFGTEIVYSKLYELIDGLDCVVSVNMLTIEINGSGAERTREGNLLLSPNVSAYLSDVDVMVNT